MTTGKKWRKTATERVGFEPTEACTSTVFENAPIDHSGTSPRAVPPDCSAGHLDCQSFGRCSVFGWQQHQHARVLDLAGRTPNTQHPTPNTAPPPPPTVDMGGRFWYHS